MPAREIVHFPKLLTRVELVRKNREPDVNTVGGRIQTARQVARLTMEQLAARVGVSKSAISQWESGGIATLNADNLIKLADVLKVSPRWLWRGKEADGTVIPIEPPTHLEPEESDLIETYRVLEPKFRDELIGDAHKYLRLAAQQKPTKANPFPSAGKPRKSVK